MPKRYMRKLLKKEKKVQDLLQSQDINKVSEEDVKSSETKILSTISIAVPGSILESVHTPHLKSYLAAQVARTASIYQVDEIIVYDDGYNATDDIEIVGVDDKKTTISENCKKLATLLQYLECPQYIRKHLFPLTDDLKYAGLLLPLDTPHHLRPRSKFPFREGVVKANHATSKDISYIDVGLNKDVLIDHEIPSGMRCTVQMHSNQSTKKCLRGNVVAPDIPRKTTGVYWGYNVRIANSLSQVIGKCPYQDGYGYDLTVGTSDRGESITKLKGSKYEHVLIVFGGRYGIEGAMKSDTMLENKNPEDLFDKYLNVVPTQGVRTIRTEESVLITLANLRTKLLPKNPAPRFMLNDLIASSEETHGQREFFHNEEDEEEYKSKRFKKNSKKDFSDQVVDANNAAAMDDPAAFD